MAPDDGERKAGRFRTQCGCPRPSEGHALARRELQRRHPEAGGGKRLKTGNMQRGGDLFSILQPARVGFLVLSSDSLFLEDTCVLKAIAHPDRPTDEEKAEAVRLTLAGLGKAELELAGSYVSPSFGPSTAETKRKSHWQACLTGHRDDRKKDDSANPPGQACEQRTPSCQPCPTVSVFVLNEGVTIAQP